MDCLGQALLLITVHTDGENVLEAKLLRLLLLLLYYYLLFKIFTQ